MSPVAFSSTPTLEGPTAELPPLRARSVEVARLLPRYGGAIATVMATCIIGQWCLTHPIARPELDTMRPSTAAVFALVGLALLVRASRPIVAVSLCAAACAATIGAASIPIVDAFFVLLLAGGTALPRDGSLSGPSGRLGFASTMTAGVLAVLALLGHLFGATALHQLDAVGSISADAAFISTVLSAACSARFAEVGVLRVLSTATTTGAAARRLLPVVIIVPLAVSCVLLLGFDVGLYDARFCIATLAAATVVFLIAAVIKNAQLSAALESQNAALVQDLADARAGEARFQALVDGAPFSVVANRGGRIVYVNPRTVEMFGCRDASELLGTDVMDLVHPDEQGRLRELDAQERKSGRPPASHGVVGRRFGTVRAARRDGKTMHLETHSRHVLVDGEELTLATAIEITDTVIANERLKEMLLEKERLLSEVHHRVKNNLQVVTSLLSLARGLVPATDATSVVFADTIQRVRAIAAVHEKLYKSREFGRVSLTDYLTSIVGDVVRGNARGVTIDFVVDCDDVVVDFNAAVPCGLIVTELVTNALKHAWPGRERGRLIVKTMRREESLIVAVTDDGVGLPAGFDGTTCEGLGMALVTGLAAQLNGQLGIDVSSGTTFAVTFPATSCAESGDS